MPDLDVPLELELTKQCDPGEAIQDFDRGLLEDPLSSEELGLPLIIPGRGLVGDTEGGCWVRSSPGAQIKILPAMPLG